jgi:hypothetical protein
MQDLDRRPSDLAVGHRSDDLLDPHPVDGLDEVEGPAVHDRLVGSGEQGRDREPGPVQRVHQPRLPWYVGRSRDPGARRRQPHHGSLALQVDPVREPAMAGGD